MILLLSGELLSVGGNKINKYTDFSCKEVFFSSTSFYLLPVLHARFRMSVLC
jgi:hypothetical protein